MEFFKIMSLQEHFERINAMLSLIEEQIESSDSFYLDRNSFFSLINAIRSELRVIMRSKVS